MSRSVKNDYDKARNPGNTRNLAQWCEDCHTLHTVKHKECPFHYAYRPATDCATCDGGGCGDCA